MVSLPECVKFNNDASVVRSVGIAGIGGLLRGDKGQVLTLFFGPASSLDPAVSETIAIKAALEVFDQTFWKGKAHLVVKSNSEVTVSWCSRPA
ncbi:hypothetical protein J1N35_046142 [Gossypium stocksii]|uniref:RNase H type-1 domain-containing protein n=1 Tax=Gossypium stocksii TaxID=47602 RepID=A0A9D3U5F0_9ROSI|nr:hypothetical protein J1N35_046142 [Gossypium stocksii]